MKEDRGRYLEIRLAERPGYGVKYPLFMAEMKVDLMGLKAAALKYWANLGSVVSWRRMPFPWFG